MERTLLFDLLCTQPTRRTRFHGGGVYGRRYFMEFLRLGRWKTAGVELSVALDPQRELPQDLSQALQEHGIPTVAVSSGQELSHVATDGRFSRFYTPVADWLIDLPSLDRFRAMELRATVHQLRQLDAPADPTSFQLQPNPLKRLYRRVTSGSPEAEYRRVHRRWARVFDVLSPPVLSISDHSRYQIATEFPHLDPDHIVVCDSLVPGPSPVCAPPDAVHHALGGAVPYLLMVNCNRQSKNLVRVIQALHRYQPRALMGKKIVTAGLHQDQYRYLMRRYPNARPFLLRLGYLEQPLLNALIRDSIGLLYPSVSEGFGYPPLEAMNLGAPVLAAAATAIPEVTADAALYFNPYSPAEIAQRINWFVHDEALRATLRQRGAERIRFYQQRQPLMVQRFSDYLLHGWEGDTT